MLSERERRQLATIEEDLETSDPGLSALLTGPGGRRRLLYARSMVAFGVLLMVAGVLLSLDASFMQGLVLASAGASWWAWIAMPPNRAAGKDYPGNGWGRGAGPQRPPGRW